MKKQDGVKNIILSGMRATVVMEEGKELEQKKVVDALGALRIKFVSMEVVDRPTPVAVFNMKAKGVT